MHKKMIYINNIQKYIHEKQNSRKLGKYRTLGNKCSNERNKMIYFRNINVKSISDNKTFWKTVSQTKLKIAMHSCPSNHKYNTRNQIFSYPNPQTLIYGIKSFEYNATQVWNSIPNEIRTASNV